MKLNIKDILIDPEIQPRVKLDDATVGEYAEAYAAGASFPPLVAFHDGTTYRLADGFHRHAAADRAQIEFLDFDIKVGGKREAILYAAGSNATHGLRRSTGDKRRAILMLLNDEEWAGWSDSKIAQRCGVDHKTVARYRPESILGISQDGVTRKAERNGVIYEIKTTNIGRSVSAVVEKPATDAEFLESLAIRGRLTERTLAIFDDDALYWRRCVDSEEYRRLVLLIEEKMREHENDVVHPALFHRFGVFVKMKNAHPRTWILCGNCRGVGCETCKRRGYAIP